MIQLRLPEESPRMVVEVARVIRVALPDVPLLVNGRADIALAAGAAGVHLGSEDVSPASLRRAVPSGFVIGASVASDVDVARTAGADYVGVGPVFAAARTDSSALGLQRFMTLAQMCGLPAVAIGGVSSANVGEVMRSGASGVVSALFAAADPMQAARAIHDAQDASGS